MLVRTRGRFPLTCLDFKSVSTIGISTTGSSMTDLLTHSIGSREPWLRFESESDCLLR